MANCPHPKFEVGVKDGNVVCTACRQRVDNVWFVYPGHPFETNSRRYLHVPPGFNTYVEIKCPVCWRQLIVLGQYFEGLRQLGVAVIDTPCCRRVPVKGPRGIIARVEEAVRAGRLRSK